MSFPRKTALAFATCTVALAAFHWRYPGKGLSSAAFADAVRFHRVRPEAAAVEKPLAAPAVVAFAGGRAPLSDYLFDDSGALDSFFAALQRLQANPDSTRVTVLHYGDSPTTADLITGDVRALLQERFGHGGHGYLLVAKPWAWYGHRDTDVSGSGWTISTAVGKMRPDTYGLGGASFQGADGAVSRIALKGVPQTSMELSYLAQTGGGKVTITASDPTAKDHPIATVETAAPDGGPARYPAWQSVALPQSTTEVGIAASGRVELFGVSFLHGQGGILYDSLGLNGASTTVLSRALDSNAWAAELRHEAPALVIINYGTNESSFGSYVDKQYPGELETAIQRIRNALPNVSILVMGPMDRGERSGIGEIDTMQTIPRIVAIQKRIAAEQHCAFFDTFNAMGGGGTMSRWYDGKPRLVSADLIHPTPQGASIVAQIFVKNLMQGYEVYSARMSGKPSPGPGKTSSAPGKPAGLPATQTAIAHPQPGKAPQP